MRDVDNLDFFNGRLKLRHLVVALAIAEHGSTVAASEALLISQPAITRLLRELEQILKTELFTRTPQGMKPTPFTSAFLSQAEAALSHIRQGVRHLEEFSEGETGDIYLGMHLAGASYPISKGLANLHRQRPNIRVHIVDKPPVELREQLSSGSLDMVVSRLQGSKKWRLPNGEPLHFERLFHEKVHILGNLHHPDHEDLLAAVEQGQQLQLSDLGERRWLLPLRGTELRSEVEGAFAEAQVPVPTTYIETSAWSLVTPLVAEEGYVAAIPEALSDSLSTSTATDADPELGTMAPLSVGDFSIEGDIGVVWAADHQLSPAARHLLTALHDACDWWMAQRG